VTQTRFGLFLPFAGRPTSVASSSSAPAPGHLRGLDGLRGIAVLSVLIYHSGLIRGGYLGVDVFFTLSGFLITRLMLQERAATGEIHVRNFYARRALRLLPALFVFLGFWAVYLLITVPPAFWPLVGMYVALVALYVANWGGLWYPLGIFGHTWSLAIEEQFYLVWPLAVVFLLRRVRRPVRIAWILLAAAIVSVMWRAGLGLWGASGRRIYWATDAHADGLLIGAALAFVIFGAGPWPSRRVLPAAGLLSALVLGALLVAIPHIPYYAFGITTVAALTTAVLILDVLSGRSRLAPAFEMGALVLVGRISYGLYLWHFPVFQTLRVLKLPGEHAPPLLILAAWGLTFVAAGASYFLIERHALAYKDRFGWSRAPAHFDAIGDPLPPRSVEVSPIPIPR
jgi:peptidoglycan/LPS O-acetylase OafA/YrhL